MLMLTQSFLKELSILSVLSDTSVAAVTNINTLIPHVYGNKDNSHPKRPAGTPC